MTLPWRARLANRLRKLADRLDGMTSVSIAIMTNPPISEARQRECIREGMNAIVRALKVETDMAVVENMLRITRKDLYAPEKKG